MKKRVTLLGASGSIGESAVDLLRQHPDQFTVVAVVGGSNAEKLAHVARTVNAEHAVLSNSKNEDALSDALADTSIACKAGHEAVLEAVEYETDIVIAAISGTAGLEATYRAIRSTRSLALANKECLVSAGALFTQAIREAGVLLLPIDSEHNALFQALGDRPTSDVERMTLTASGGAFLHWSKSAMDRATPEAALKHPVWSMGAKISVDSTTLMNKGLELIEAHHLFGLPSHKLDVAIHPQSFIHGLVSFCDGSVVAGMSFPDMRIPLAHCLGFPDRLKTCLPRFNPFYAKTLTFEPPDEERFPALPLARWALEIGGATPAILNAANEVAVLAFLKGHINFGRIIHVVAQTCEALGRRNEEPTSLEHIFDIHDEARALALKQVTVYENA